MSNVDTRQDGRDSLFLLAKLNVDGLTQDFRVKVRNLSTGGMMAEGEVPVNRGDVVTVDLRNIGTVPGSVAWTQGNRFGIAFLEEIDPKLARGAAPPEMGEIPRYARPATEEAKAANIHLRKL